MLQKLVIKNIALIDNAEINFTEGLNVLSGETGSGKSVILESLNFVLGAKADKNLIRSGQSECFVKAEFDVANNTLISDVYNELDIDGEETLIISRKFNVDGKSSIKVNGNTVTVAMLKKFTDLLVDVHGQSEHYHLLKTSNQLDLIDRFGGEEIYSVKSQLKCLFSEYKSIIDQLEDLGGDENRVLLRLDVLNYQINEIESADLKNGEEDELLIQKEKLLNQAKISDVMSITSSTINDEGGVLDRLNYILKSLSTITNYSDDYSNLYDRLYNALTEIDDVASQSKNELDSLDFNDFNIDAIEERLESIKKLKKKYGDSITIIEKFLNDAKLERDKLENFNQTSEVLNKQKQQLEEKIYSNYVKLSSLRKNSAKQFSSSVLLELSELGMNKADFYVDFTDIPCIDDCLFESPNGVDKIEFMFSANIGQPVKPLSFVISGGEMSRFMLAVKVQTSKLNNISTYVFDEIDAGISGKTANVVSEKFAKISRDIQVIAITHLPQISAMADNNLLICKTEFNNLVTTNVLTLDNDKKVEEIVRLVGGNIDSISAVNHAKEIIAKAKIFKDSLA